jgi:hypothetical protein
MDFVCELRYSGLAGACMSQVAFSAWSVLSEIHRLSLFEVRLTDILAFRRGVKKVTADEKVAAREPRTKPLYIFQAADL